MSALENFLRRWSTIEITPDNGLLFDEHLSGVRVLIEPADAKYLENLSRNTPRTEFAKRYQTLSTTKA